MRSGVGVLSTRSGRVGMLRRLRRVFVRGVDDDVPRAGPSGAGEQPKDGRRSVLPAGQGSGWLRHGGCSVYG